MTSSLWIWFYSGLLVSIQIVGWFWLGWLLTGRPNRNQTLFAHPLIQIWLGWYVQALGILFMGYLGLLKPYYLALFLLILAGGAFLDRHTFRKAFPSLPRLHFNRTTIWIGLNLVVWSSVALCVIYQPTNFYDTLHYHYSHPLYWLQHQKIVPLGPSIKAAVPMPTRLHYTLALGLSDWTYPTLLFVVGSIFTALALRESIKLAIDNPKWKTVALLLFITTPALWQQFHYRGNDMFLAWGGATFLLTLLLLLKKENTSYKDILFFGIIGATCASTKLSGLTAWVAFASFDFLIRISRKHFHIFRLFKHILLLALPFLVLAGIWLGHSWYMGGHPLFFSAPYLGKYEIASQRWMNTFIYTFRPPHNLLSLFNDIKNQVQFFYKGGSIGMEGFYGLIVLFAVPLALASQRIPRHIFFWWFEAALGYYVTLRYPRYALYMLPLNILVTCLLLRALASPKRWQILIVLTGFIHLFLFSTNPWTGQTFLQSYAHLLRIERKPVQLHPSIYACTWLNEHEERISSVLFVGETLYFPCKIPYIYWDPYFKHPLEHLHGLPPQQAWANYMKKHRISHIVYNPAQTLRLFDWPPGMHARWQQWLSRHGQVVYRKGDGPQRLYIIQLHLD